LSPGLAWSPDGAFVAGRSADEYATGGGLRVTRVADGNAVTVRVRIPAAGGAVGSTVLDLYQPDWR
jgi:hypothetical protein